MRVRGLFGARSMASPHHRKIQSRRHPMEIFVLVLRLASVGLLTGVGWIHLHLWQIGYRHIPSIGPLFLAAAIGALAIAGALLLRPSRMLGVLGSGLAVGILAGLVVSVNVGLFGFTESLQAPFVVESIALEMAGAVSLATWVGMDLLQQTRYRGRRLQGRRASHDGAVSGISSFNRRPHANVQN
ncbi:MAG TPA: hypothetical protein VFV02_16440 [Acidimicrobiales bacterium]|nr:hypothetical protein [Acidimicrobiales bacterium]